MWFQIFSVVQWLLQTYWHYALIVAFITALAATTSLVISRGNFRRLRELSRHVRHVTVIRGDTERVIESTDLVPGAQNGPERTVLLGTVCPASSCAEVAWQAARGKQRQVTERQCMGIYRCLCPSCPPPALGPEPSTRMPSRRGPRLDHCEHGAAVRLRTRFGGMPRLRGAQGLKKIPAVETGAREQRSCRRKDRASCVLPVSRTPAGGVHLRRPCNFLSTISNDLQSVRVSCCTFRRRCSQGSPSLWPRWPLRTPLRQSPAAASSLEAPRRVSEGRSSRVSCLLACAPEQSARDIGWCHCEGRRAAETAGGFSR